MAYEHNDIATKNRLRAALEESNMGFEHNDIVTMDVMNAAIAEGGGGGGIATPNVTATWKLDGILPSGVGHIEFAGLVEESGGEYIGVRVADPETSEGVVSGLDYPALSLDDNKLMWSAAVIAYDSNDPSGELTIAFSDCVNCEDDGLGEVLIIDKNSPASFTVTISE